MTRIIRPEPLTREAFAPFGDVIMLEGAHHYPINAGTTERFHDLARIDVTRDGGHALFSIFRGEPFSLPLDIRVMERHPLGSQAFYPLSAFPYLVVAGSGEKTCGVDTLRCFLAVPGQGVNYARNVWHHPLIALGDTADFVVIDRGGDGDNLQEAHFDAGIARLEM